MFQVLNKYGKWIGLFKWTLEGHATDSLKLALKVKFSIKYAEMVVDLIILCQKGNRN